MSSSTVLAQSALLFVVRAGLYQLCQRVLSSLVQDLRHISSATTGPSSSQTHVPGPVSQPESSDGEDEVLPTPASASVVTATPAGGFLAPRLSPNRSRLGRSTLTSRNASSGSHGVHFHARASRIAFAICFSENILLFVLVLCQSLDLLSERTLFINWRVSLTVVVALVMVIIPLLMSMFVTYRSSSGAFRKRTLIALIPYSCYLYLVTLIPDTSHSPSPSSTSATGDSVFSPSTPNDPNTQLAFPLPQALSRLALMGVIILGILSGFGAIRNASVLVSSLASNRMSEKAAGKRKANIGVTEEDLSHAEGSLRRVRGDLEERRAQLTRAAGQAANEPKGGSWIPRVFGGGDELSGLRQEIDGLEALEKQMARSLTGMWTRRERDVFAGTFRGRLLNGTTALFGIYCVYRVVISSVNLLLPWSRSTPAAAGAAPTDVVIRWILSTFPSLEISLELTPERAVSLSRQFSLLMVGAIVMSSVRLVLRGVNQVLRVSSKKLGASLMLLILAQLMATYLLSTLIQLRTSFPPPESIGSGSTTPSLFSTLPQFEVFGPLFDLSFVLSALASSLIRWVGGAFSEEQPWGWEMVELQTRR